MRLQVAGDAPLRWDIYGRVVDNLGDVGGCWRLACELASRGEHVRLVLDDASALAWMAPVGRLGVTLLPWPGPVGPTAADAPPGDVVVETYGCDLPAAARRPLRAAHPGAPRAVPTWIDVEHLSAEPFVERSHGLPSPQADGCVRWFFFPGFGAATGGLVRERDLEARRSAHDAAAWRAAHAIEPRRGERVALLFAYEHAPLAAALAALAAEPTLLLVPPGPPTRLVEAARAALGRDGWPAAVRTQPLPWLTQRAFDRLLWSCDLAFVRGEDSLVRALWAGVPFVWQAYAQDDGAHHAKIDALLAAGGFDPAVAAWWRWWNRAPGAPVQAPPLPPLVPWRGHTRRWARALADDGPDLVGRLQAFARRLRSGAGASPPG